MFNHSIIINITLYFGFKNIESIITWLTYKRMFTYKTIHLFIHSLNKHMLRVYYEPGIDLTPRDRSTNYIFLGSYFTRGEIKYDLK